MTGCAAGLAEARFSLCGTGFTSVVVGLVATVANEGFGVGIGTASSAAVTIGVLAAGAVTLATGERGAASEAEGFSGATYTSGGGSLSVLGEG